MFYRRIRFVIGEVDGVPWYMGIAWDDWNRRQMVCFPLGINVLVRWLRNAWFWLRYREPAKIARICEDRDMFMSESNRLREELRNERDKTARLERCLSGSNSLESLIRRAKEDTQ